MIGECRQAAIGFGRDEPYKIQAPFFRGSGSGLRFRGSGRRCCRGRRNSCCWRRRKRNGSGSADEPVRRLSRRRTRLCRFGFGSKALEDQSPQDARDRLRGRAARCVQDAVGLLHVIAPRFEPLACNRTNCTAAAKWLQASGNSGTCGRPGSSWPPRGSLAYDHTRTPGPTDPRAGRISHNDTESCSR